MFAVIAFVQQNGNSGQARKFAIDSNSGVVNLTGSLDYETRTFYHYQVVAKVSLTFILSVSLCLCLAVSLSLFAFVVFLRI